MKNKSYCLRHSFLYRFKKGKTFNKGLSVVGQLNSLLRKPDVNVTVDRNVPLHFEGFFSWLLLYLYVLKWPGPGSCFVVLCVALHSSRWRQITVDEALPLSGPDTRVCCAIPRPTGAGQSNSIILLCISDAVNTSFVNLIWSF